MEAAPNIFSSWPTSKSFKCTNFEGWLWAYYNIATHALPKVFKAACLRYDELPKEEQQYPSMRPAPNSNTCEAFHNQQDIIDLDKGNGNSGTDLLTLSIVEPDHSSETASSNEPIPTARLSDLVAQRVCTVESPAPGEKYCAWARQRVPAPQPWVERKNCAEINASLPLERFFFFAGQKGSRPLFAGQNAAWHVPNQKQTDNRGLFQSQTRQAHQLSREERPNFCTTSWNFSSSDWTKEAEATSQEGGCKQTRRCLAQRAHSCNKEESRTNSQRMKMHKAMCWMWDVNIIHTSYYLQCCILWKERTGVLFT